MTCHWRRLATYIVQYITMFVIVKYLFSQSPGLFFTTCATVFTTMNVRYKTFLNPTSYTAEDNPSPNACAILSIYGTITTIPHVSRSNQAGQERAGLWLAAVSGICQAEPAGDRTGGFGAAVRVLLLWSRARRS